MSSTRRKSRIRGSRPRLRTHMTRTTIEPRSSMPGRPPYTIRLPIPPITVYPNTTPPTTPTRSSLIRATWLGTRRPGIWGIRGRRISAAALRLIPLWPPSIHL
jgi:hypothetical protein